jgi:pyrroloquinoline quinone biosynthesis protein E
VDRSAVAPPASLLAEVTHRCPLHCLYCSNPLELARRAEELTTEVWLRVLDDAAGLGVLQVHFSGGEPLLRPDLGTLVERSARHQLYSNLITSGVGLTPGRVRALRDAGLGAVQVSVQAARPDVARTIAGGEFWERKMEAAHAVREAGLPLSLNVVLHRHNLPQVTELLELARTLGAERVELANTQYYGWALLNRDHLLPDRESLAKAEEDVDRFRRQDHGGMEIVWVVPDYHAEFPKPCMNGWGRMFLTVTPDGTALPCPVASVIPDLHPPSVRHHALGWIWYESPAFNRYRGSEWMPEPCRSCPRRTVDFGGCRCQAYLLTGNPTATDPVCTYSPDHHLIAEAVAGAGRGSGPAPAYRKNPDIARRPVLL